MPSLYKKNRLFELENILDIKLQDKKLLQKAVTHKSFPNENQALNLNDNERLEFLGDAVLNLSISSYIFYKYPQQPECELAKIKSVVVSEDILAQKANQLDLGKYIILGKGEEITGGRNRKSILADTMEAVLGAIYLDKDFIYVKSFIQNLFEKEIKKVAKGTYIKDYKTILQEIIQKQELERPQYYVINENGPEHNKTFQVDVKLKDKSLGQGTGLSKKEAEQEAAKIALEKMNII
jgi:ribonuclease-3